jgi:hypothetical protein
MKKTLLFFFFLWFFIQLNAQDTILYGRLLDMGTARGIENIHIVNLSNGRGAVSELHGYFHIRFSQGDSILLSSVHYRKKIIRPLHNGDTLFVFLMPETYMLPVVRVLKYTTYSEFLEAVLTLPKEQYEKDEIPWFRDYLAETKNEYTYVKSFSPITYLYDRYSKKAKEMQRYNFLIEQDKVYNQISLRYNEQMVSRITGIISPDSVKAFMQFCRLPEAFLLTAKDYEIHLAVLDCYRNYKQK